MDAFKITIPLLRAVDTGKAGKKISVNAQAFYASMNSFASNNMADRVKRHIAGHILSQQLSYRMFDCRVALFVEINAARQDFDVDNLGYVWMKCFLDAVKEVNPFTKEGKLKKVKSTQYLSRPILKEDSAKHVAACPAYLGDRRDDTITFQLVPLNGSFRDLMESVVQKMEEEEWRKVAILTANQ